MDERTTIPGVVHNRLVDSGRTRTNNFDFLRHLAAFLVIFGHSQALLSAPYSHLWANPIATFGVVIFFSLSGYLIAQSWIVDPSVVRFVRKRTLRIVPGLWVAVILCACVLGPGLTSLSLQDYIHNSHFKDYFYNLVFNIHYFLPGLYDGNPYPSAVNGSLWSLPVECFCYALVVLTFRIPIGTALQRVLVLLLSFLVAGYGLSQYYHGPQIVIYATDVQSATAVIPYFLVGALLQIGKDRIPLRLDVAMILVFLLFSIEGLGFSRLLLVATWLLVPYVVLSFGASSTPIVRRWGRFGDFSYGIYLYSFPLQQALVQVTHARLGVPALVLSATTLSLIAAFASWNLIEKPALRYKSRRVTAMSPTMEMTAEFQPSSKTS